MESRELAQASKEDTLNAKVDEGKEIIAKASRLKYRMARDQTLE